MKKFKNLMIVFVLMTLCFNTKLSAQAVFDPSTGIFTFNYSPCSDPCSGATTDDCSKQIDVAGCKKECDNQALTDKEWLACIHKCIPPPVKVTRRPIAWVAVFVITTTTPSNQSAWKTFNVPQQNTSNPSFTVDTKNIWTDVNFYCYYYGVRILYDDGTECLISSQTWLCNA
jgi:hypothetical protein